MCDLWFPLSSSLSFFLLHGGVIEYFLCFARVETFLVHCMNEPVLLAVHSIHTSSHKLCALQATDHLFLCLNECYYINISKSYIGNLCERELFLRMKDFLGYECTDIF